MTEDRTIRDLAAEACADAERTDALLARVEAPGAASPDDEEEAFVREVLARGNDERLVEAALGAVKSSSVPVVAPRAARTSSGVPVAAPRAAATEARPSCSRPSRARA